MEYENRKKLSRQVIQTLDSLNKTVTAAGGVPFDYNAMVTMTLFDFIWEAAAPNGIRFYLQKPIVALDDKEEEEEETRPLGYRTNDGAAELTPSP